LKRLLYHFSRFSDIVALQQLPDTDLKQELLKPYRFAFSQETAEHYYLEQGKRQRDGFLNERLKAGVFKKEYLAQTQENRFVEVHEMLRHLTENGQKVCILDYGCGHGWCALFLALNNPDLKIIGYDIDPGAVGFANALATQAGVADRVEFVCELD
ncbi:MAG: class I SAM-dependent methyltransferase, partial [Phycisphaerae bacterium]|nr:class I SAM-dependent methyltransferase [Phycisphaerae bacterium]